MSNTKTNIPAVFTPNQNIARIALEATAKYESQYPNAALAAMGKGMCKSAPIAPLRTVGTALLIEATKQIKIASVADRPAATIELP